MAKFESLTTTVEQHSMKTMEHEIMESTAIPPQEKAWRAI
jgi:hypothetical protein